MSWGRNLLLPLVRTKMANRIRAEKPKVMKNANWMILLLLVWSEACIQQSIAQNTATLSQYEGDTVTLSCSLSGTFTLPQWQGPPSFTSYTIQDDVTRAINPAAPAASRLQYASNNRDLILSNVVIADSGDYQCAYTGLGDHTITLTVNLATTTPAPPGRFEWWKILLIVLGSILLVEFLVGIILGCVFRGRYPANGNGICNFKGFPPWYKKLWKSVIGIPVALGVLLVWKCYQ